MKFDWLCLHLLFKFWLNKFFPTDSRSPVKVSCCELQINHLDHYLASTIPFTSLISVVMSSIALSVKNYNYATKLLSLLITPAHNPEKLMVAM